jgi:methionine-gamma-lyase
MGDSLETLLQYADGDDGESDIAPPMHLSVPFSAARAEFDEFSRVERPDRFYRRYANPTQTRLERMMAALEGAEAALATGSGIGAVSAVFLTLLGNGDHVIGQKSMYGGSLSLLQDLAPRLGVDVTLVDQTDPEAFARALTPTTRLIMTESPSNPLLQLTDLAAVATLARDHGILTMTDNTVATPVNQRPLDLGIDLVVHSLTKAASGHSDVLAGVIVGRRELIERVWRTHIVLGSVLSPFDSWLALRGLRTLGLRVERHNRNALAVSRFLDGHPAVATVHYPGLASHPQHDLAQRQMRGGGGLLSFEVRGGAEATERLLDTLRLASRAPSLGGHRALAVRPAAMWTHELTPEQLAKAGVAPGLIRFAVGLEDDGDLIADLRRALGGAEWGET